jgi:hypothetical protein
VKNWIKKLERKGRDEEVIIPLEDGTEARFPHSALQEAFVHEMGRFEGEHDEPPHPLTIAATNSSDPQVRNSALASLTGVDEDGNIRPAEPVPDLSEP